MVQVVVNGVFAEDYAENKRPLFRSFSRTFCIVPVGSGWSIISDMLFITTVTDEILIVRILFSSFFFFFYKFVIFLNL